jgi:hypothetical protein
LDKTAETKKKNRKKKDRGQTPDWTRQRIQKRKTEKKKDRGQTPDWTRQRRQKTKTETIFLVCFAFCLFCLFVTSDKNS